jgi:plastocyanin
MGSTVHAPTGPRMPGGRRAEARRVAQARSRRRLAWGAAAVAFAALLALVVVVISGGGDDGAPERVGDGSATRVSMTDFAFDPDPLVLSSEEGLVTVVNDGAVAHDLVVPALGKGTPDLAPGAELTIDLSGQPAGTYEVICDIPGHREAGMVSQLVIE